MTITFTSRLKQKHKVVGKSRSRLDLTAECLRPLTEKAFFVVNNPSRQYRSLQHLAQ